MKKLLAIVLTVVLLSCALIIPVSAVDDAENDLLYLDSFKKIYVDEEGMGADLLFYEELYYSKDNNGDVEWAFIHAQTNMVCPEIVDRDFHGVHVQQANIYVPFQFGYGVYDVKEDKFYDLSTVSYYNQTHDTPKYEYAFDLFKTYYKPENTGNRYEDSFVNWTTSKYGEEWMSNYSYNYNELYTHYDGEQPDWVLCRARYNLIDGTNVSEPMITWLRIGGIGGRTVINYSWDNPFAMGYGVYDVKANEFYALEDLTDDCFMPKYTGLSADNYDGLTEALAELNIGYVTGDANKDNKVDILDSAFIQKIAAGKASIGYNDKIVLDVNRDNTVDILDSTIIQMALVAE